jgi:hypothetical protein
MTKTHSILRTGKLAYVMLAMVMALAAVFGVHTLDSAGQWGPAAVYAFTSGVLGGAGGTALGVVMFHDQ